MTVPICKADMVIKGQAVDAIVNDDTLIDDGHAGSTFNYYYYCLSKEWLHEVIPNDGVLGYALAA